MPRTFRMTSKFDFDSWQAKMVALEIANEAGRAILRSLSEQPKTATQMSKSLSIPLPTILFHLSRLEESGLVVSKKALGKRLREVKVYSVSSADIVFNIGGGKDGQEGNREAGKGT
jgi:predicted ArsR family transcriptional regulator